MVCPCLFKCFSKLLGFSIASDKASESARGCRLQTRAGGSNSRNFVNLHRLAHPLHLNRTERLHLHKTFGQLQCVVSDHDGSRRRHLLHTRSQMHGLTDRGVVHLQVVADRTDHYFSGIQTHSDLNRHTLCPPHSVSIALHRLLHSERRIAGTHRVIFVR